MKKALMVSTVIGFLSSFERSDISILLNMGYEVHIACNCNIYGSEEKLRLLENMRIVKHHISFARSPFSKTNFNAYKQLKQLITQEKFDLVHCHTPVGGFLGRIAAKKSNVPVIIYTAHGFHFFKGCPIKNKVLFYPIEKIMSCHTDILITINNEDYDIASRKFYAKKVERIHGVGIDIDKFEMKDNCREEKRKELGIVGNQTMLLSVGELDRDKNHIEILEAMKTLGKEGYVLIIAGRGTLMDSYVQYIKRNGLEECVHLLGYRSDVAELLQAADIYVFPSLFEGLSVALMEAIAAKKPIACSEVRGNVDTVITPESYFATDKPYQLVRVIHRLSLMTEAEKKAMIEENYQNLLKYKLSEVQKEMTEIYKYANEIIDEGEKKV